MITLSSVRSTYSLFRRRRSAANQVRLELGRLTDAELNDIGISRSAISRLAREAAEATI